MFIARNLTFYPDYFTDNSTELSDEIIIPSYHLNNIIDTFDDNEMLYVNITNTEKNLSYLVAIGAPHNFDKNTIFAPQWILDTIGCSGSCDSIVIIEKANVSEIPSATKIVIKPLDSLAFEIDTANCFEKAFMNLHSIKEGLTVSILVPELGDDYQLLVYIEKVEPAQVSRIIQGEVDVEFINEFVNESVINEPVVNKPVNEPFNEFIPVLEPVSEKNTVIEEIDINERRRRIRDSWLNRF